MAAPRKSAILVEKAANGELEAIANPEGVVKALQAEINRVKDPEKRKEYVKKLMEVTWFRRIMLTDVARMRDDIDGFSAFYWLVHGNPLPKHASRWIEHLYGAKGDGYEGSVVWCWRGSWKSTTIGVTFTAFRMGKNPELTNMVVMANDDSADKVTGAIAQIIENNPAWKWVFPFVEPDRDRGWGAEGYWVKDTRYTKEQWAMMNARVIDPSLVAGGYNSSRLIGKHPTGMLLIDDIHDEKNSDSERARQHVVKVMSDTILPMAVRDEGGRLMTWIVAIGTPWADDDALHYLRNTGVFAFLNIPVMRPAKEGRGVYCDGRNRNGAIFNDLMGWWHLEWPERFSIETLVSERAKAGMRGFARMFRMDLEAAKGEGLRYHSFPHEMIDLHWPMYGGADLAFTVKESVKVDPGRDKFSHAYGARHPLGKIVVVDGVIEQCTQGQAEVHLRKAQDMFPSWNYTLLEGDGLGETFFVSLVMRNPGLRVRMDKTKGKSKRYRQEQEMGPWLESGRVVISDADTPYLNALRKALDDFPDGNNDIRDGLYWLCRTMPDVLVQPNEEKIEQAGASGWMRVKPQHPAFAFAKTRR